jgi:threonine dehydrogenase-like Zn-dependent dehydrogenase
MKSTYSSHLNIDASSLVVDEISLVGSRCGPFPKALKMLSEENINLSPMVHHRFPIEQGLKAFEEAQKPGVLKVIVEFK